MIKTQKNPVFCFIWFSARENLSLSSSMYNHKWCLTISKLDLLKKIRGILLQFDRNSLWKVISVTLIQVFNYNHSFFFCRSVRFFKFLKSIFFCKCRCKPRSARYCHGSRPYTDFIDLFWDLASSSSPECRQAERNSRINHLAEILNRFFGSSVLSTTNIYQRYD